MELYKYASYEEYVEAQTRANIKKIRNVWVRPSTIDKIKSVKGTAQTILCHGTRNGTEQGYFHKAFPFAEVIGTEVSHTATQFPMTVQWDFHEVKAEWVNKFDIVYSNSFDHSYDPDKCLETWVAQLSPNGMLFMEHPAADIDNRSRATDPLSISLDELIELLDSKGIAVTRQIHQDAFRNHPSTILACCKK